MNQQRIILIKSVFAKNQIKQELSHAKSQIEQQVNFSLCAKRNVCET